MMYWHSLDTEAKIINECDKWYSDICSMVQFLGVYIAIGERSNKFGIEVGHRSQATSTTRKFRRSWSAGRSGADQVPR